MFTPFSIQLRNTKPHVPAQGEHPSFVTPGSKFGEVTHVLVPFINVTMDSKEFNILVDVINNVGVAEVLQFTSPRHAGVLWSVSPSWYMGGGGFVESFLHLFVAFPAAEVTPSASCHITWL